MKAIFKNLKIGDHFLLEENGQPFKKTNINQYKSLDDKDTIYLIAPMTWVFQYEISLWLIKDHKEEGLFEPREIKCNKIEGNTYYIDEFPYKATINDAYSQDNGYGSGFGNLWSWSYFVCLSETVAQQLYQKLQNEFEKKRKPSKHFFATAY